MRRRRARLERLLDLRSTLAELNAERSSHRLDDAPEIFGQLLAIEATLSDEYPEVYLRELPRWVEQDARIEHDGSTLQPTCGICRAIAIRSGVNLTAPEAA